MSNTEETRDFVKERYGAAALQVLQAGDCAKGSCCGNKIADPITVDLYDSAQSRDVPAEALLASLGCGNPTALAELKPGETVLDLGSGGGIDVLLSAKRVGPTGKAYGLDMTDEMLDLARRNQAKSGVGNVEFLKGNIEEIPLPDASVDVIISNCVINLSADKDAVLQEAFRVLKPGGRLAVADIVTKGALPESVRKHIDFWTNCVSGALQEDEYISKLEAAGFADAALQTVRTYDAAEARGLLTAEDGQGISKQEAEQVADSLYSAFIRASRPAK